MQWKPAKCVVCFTVIQQFSLAWGMCFGEIHHRVGCLGGGGVYRIGFSLGPLSQTEVKSALEVTGDCLPRPVTSSPNGAVGNDPREYSNAPLQSPAFPLHTYNITHTHMYCPQPGGAQESVAWGKLFRKPGVECVFLDKVCRPPRQPVDAPSSPIF